ncbi:MAG: hypothetical protein LC104_20255 [Bacteroidales bacterium]|nr:hypothetical protein [Bacteroidales bacterium]
MRGWAVWAALIGGIAVLPAAAQVAPPAERRPDPALFLLPPEASPSAPAPSSTRTQTGSDLPPPLATQGRETSPNWRKPAESETFEPARRIRQPVDLPPRGDDDDRRPPRTQRVAEPDDDRRPPRANPDKTPSAVREPEWTRSRDRDPIPVITPDESPRSRDGRTAIPPVRGEPDPTETVRGGTAPRSEGTRPAVYEPTIPAARLGKPQDIQPVSAEVIADAKATAAQDRNNRQSINLIEYLKERPIVADAAGLPREAEKFGDRIFGTSGGNVLGVDGGGWFQSDHSFPTYVSPITNPFLFEDPRSVTEVRPIFIYQKVPNREPVLNGGDLYWIGTQARIAFTNRFSVVINKLGGVGVNPSNNFNNFFDGSQFGFSEFWLGPKFTLIRNTETGTLLAAGATFQLPIGSNNVYQNTGDLSIVPYLTYGQNFWQSTYGSFNGLIGTGYSASVNAKRSDYYYLSAHLDYDIGNRHRFYPVAELNWFTYTTNGNTSPLNFEGRDLINFGSASRGSNLLTGALGMRFKVFSFSEIGGAFEIPLVGNRDLFDYRFTLDYIWRF